MMQPWVAVARQELAKLQSRSGGWGYRAGSEPSVEPTVLASFGLLLTDSDGESRSHVRAAAQWIARLQQADGAIGPTAGLRAPGWPVPLAVMLWRAMNDFEPHRKRSIHWLLKREGEVFIRGPNHPAGHDTSIQGWPWVTGTHPWLEPTAMAVVALRAAGYGNHPRVRDGLRLIKDRAIPGGGWNYGNSLAFDTPLRPQPAPTGLALIALAGVERARGRVVREACDYLAETLPRTRSPQTLCWGLWGLEVWEMKPEAAESWLREAHALVENRPDPVLQLGYLLMASASPRPCFAPLEEAA